MDHTADQGLACVRLRLYGVVQGVGFRPFVAGLAARFGILGTVRNAGGCVDIMAAGQRDALCSFERAVCAQTPPHAQIMHQLRQELPWQPFHSFEILPSGDSSGPVFLPADLPVCQACLEQMRDAGDRRYAHPFISCMSCGPRYSVIERVPYDRDTTTMRDFPMCAACAKEYANPANRRFHAQTIGCHDCGPALFYRDAAGNVSRGESAFDRAVCALQGGGIVAVKGIGGYHLACSPFDGQAVSNLRLLKQREQKPFAVLFGDIQSIEACCSVSAFERELLQSPARPIVLLRGDTRHFSPQVCMHSRHIGAFIAYTPLQAMLVQALGPLVMTSANVSENPIIKDDDAMFSWQSALLCGVLYNRRRISIRLDDSVLSVVGGEPLMIRRSRGFAPLPVVIKADLPADRCVFAAGAQMKSAFALVKAPFATLSEHVGDLDCEDNAQAYASNYERMRDLFSFSPDVACCDAHPAYFSTAFAKNLGLPVIEVQHHHAHIASVIAEHGLCGKIIGIAFDGTGYGADAAVWGGEFLVCEGAQYTRAGHLRYVALIGAELASRDATIPMMCHLYASGLEEQIDDARFPILKAAIDGDGGAFQCSSVGRLFDAVAAYLGICAYNRFEAECAQALENLAAQALERGILPVPMHFDIRREDDTLLLDASPVWRSLVRHRNGDASALSLGFHTALSEAACALCRMLGVAVGSDTVALSGGVFQNRVLFALMSDGLKREGFRVYTNNAVPVNDGGIALGQAYVALGMLAKTGA